MVEDVGAQRTAQMPASEPKIDRREGPDPRNLSEQQLVECVLNQQNSIEGLEQQLSLYMRQLEASLEQIKALSAMLHQAEDQMQQQVSQLLHDDVQQGLYGLRLELLNLARLLSQSLPQEAKPETEAMLNSLLALVEGTGATVRHVIFTLSPPVRPDAMLPEVLQALASRMRSMYGFDVRVGVSESFDVFNGEVPFGAGTLLFNLLRQLLFNLVKYANAQRADVFLHREEQMVVLEVEADTADLGSSFPSGEQGPAGFGGVEQRIRAAGGWVEHRNSRDIALRLCLPLDGLALLEG